MIGKIICDSIKNGVEHIILKIKHLNYNLVANF